MPTPTHIQFPDVAPVIRYAADGVRSTYEYPFPIFAADDLRVYFDNAPQNSGFTVNGAGQSEGGSVLFDTPPPADNIVRLEREMPYERLTDFLEGGEFSARAINTELDVLTAGLQQVARGQDGMLRYDPSEEMTAQGLTLPGRAQRAGQVLGFDGDGNPIAVSAAGTMSAPNFTAQGTGAIVRSIPDKLNEAVSVKDFGAVGDGLADDTLAIQKALAEHNAVYLPAGTYLISAPVRLGSRQSLRGVGQSSTIRCQSNNFAALELSADYITLADLRIEGGAPAVRLFGAQGPCVQSAITDIQIIAPQTGVELDGYTDPSRPCYWNNLTRVLIESPSLHGVHLRRSGAGDTPNANRFHMVRVQSKSVPMSGSGFYVEEGSFNNSFIDCEANVDGTAAACFRIGPGSNKTILINPYTESVNQVPNVQLDPGSIETAIYNLLSASDGAAIFDLSGGEYEAYNAGFPEKNKLRRTSVSDLNATLMRYDTEFIDTPGLVEIDLSHTQHIVNASGGAIEMRLPAAGDAVGVTITIKKVDNTANIVSITEADGNGGSTGPGPDRRSLALGGHNDYATMLSNGAQWFIISSNRSSGNTRFFDGSGTYDIDMAVDVYLLSSFGGDLIARLPPANAAQAIGRVITIKKTDPSTNPVSVSEQGGAGPDNATQPLSAQYDAITVVSNGSQWYILSKL